MPGDAPLINGNAFSYGSIILKLDGEVYTGFTAITYADKRERSYAHGAGKAQGPRGMTRGKYTPEAVALTMHRDSVHALLSALAASANNTGSSTSFGDTPFTIEVTYEENGLDVVTDTIEQCKVTGINHGNDEGPDALTTELEIMPMRIRHNGLTLFDESA